MSEYFDISPPAEPLTGASATMQAGGVPRRDQDLPDAASPEVSVAHDIALGRVIRELCNRMTEQENQWGGDAHDDTHHPLEWLGFMRKFQERAASAYSIMNTLPTNFVYEDNMLDIAALAVKAILSSRRKARQSTERTASVNPGEQHV